MARISKPSETKPSNSLAEVVQRQHITTRRRASEVARQLGCRGAHRKPDGTWAPCEDPLHLITLLRRGVRGYRKLDEKALGPSLGSMRKRKLKPATYNPNARDADSDARVQEGTTAEHPATGGMPKSKKPQRTGGPKPSRPKPTKPKRSAAKKPAAKKPQPKKPAAKKTTPEKPKIDYLAGIENVEIREVWRPHIAKKFAEWDRDADEKPGPRFHIIAGGWDLRQAKDVAENIVPEIEDPDDPIQVADEIWNAIPGTNDAVVMLDLQSMFKKDPDQAMGYLGEFLGEALSGYQISDVVFRINGSTVRISPQDDFQQADEFIRNNVLKQVAVMFGAPDTYWYNLAMVHDPGEQLIRIRADDGPPLQFMNLQKEDVVQVPQWLHSLKRVRRGIERDDWSEPQEFDQDVMGRIFGLVDRIEEGENIFEVLDREDFNLLALKLAENIDLVPMAHGERGVSVAHWVVDRRDGKAQRIGVLKVPEDINDVGGEHIREVVAAEMKEVFDFPAYRVLPVGPMENARMGPRRHLLVEHVGQIPGVRITSPGIVVFAEDESFGPVEVRDALKIFFLDIINGNPDRHPRNFLRIWTEKDRAHGFLPIDEGRAFVQDRTDEVGIDDFDQQMADAGWLVLRAIEDDSVTEEQVKKMMQTMLDNAKAKLNSVAYRHNVFTDSTEMSWENDIRRQIAWNADALLKQSVEDLMDAINNDGAQSGVMQSDNWFDIS